MDDYKEPVSSRHHRTDTYELTGTVQHTQDLHRFKLGGVPALREGSRHKLPLLIQKLFVIDTKSHFFSNGVPLAISTTSQGRPQCQGVVGQYELHFVCVCVIFVLVFFLILLDFFKICFVGFFLKEK